MKIRGFKVCRDYLDKDIILPKRSTKNSAGYDFCCAEDVVIEYKLKKGELVTRADVEADASAVAAEVRERLTSIPVRISALCEHQPARKIEEVMTDAIQDALVSFSKSKFVKGHGDGE